MRTAPVRVAWISALALVLLIAGCGPNVDDAPPLPSRTERAMTLLPTDARFVGMVDLQDLQQNGGLSFSSDRGLTVRFLDSDVTFNPLSTDQQDRLQAFIEATGFEPGSDLHAAYVAGDSTAPQAVLLAASFDRERLIGELITTFEARLDTTSYRSVPILRLEADGSNPSLQFALMDDGWMALSANTTQLHLLIDRSLDTTVSPSSSAIMPLVAALGGRGGAWFTLRDLPAQRLAQSADRQRTAQLARAVRDAGTALNFTDDGVSGTVLLTTHQDPADLADVVRGAVSTLRLNDDLTQEQQALLDQIAVTEGNDGRVWVTFEVSQETLARFLIQSVQSRDGRGFAVLR